MLSIQKMDEFYSGYRSWVEQLNEFHANTLSDASIRDWQNTGFRRALRDAVDGSPFYKEKYADIDLDSMSIDRIGDLPFLTKHEHSAHGIALLRKPLGGGGLYFETTGTSGDPVPCPRSGLELSQGISSVAASVSRVLGNYIANPEKSVVIMGPSDLHSTGDVMGSAFIHVGFTVFKAWPFSMAVSIERLIGLLRKYQIEVLVATAGQIHMLCAAAKSKGLDVRRDFNVKYIFMLGEILTPNAIKNLSNIWQAEIINFMYGSQDSSVVAMSSERGDLHLQSLSYVCECIEIGGKDPVPMGELGELVVTRIQPDLLKPMIRYRTGDSCIFTKDETAPLSSPILKMMGRVADFVEIGSCIYSPFELDVIIMDNFQECMGYLIRISHEAGQDKLDIMLEFFGEAEEEGIDTLKGFWKVLGIRCEIGVADKMITSSSFTGTVPWKNARIRDERT